LVAATEVVLGKQPALICTGICTLQVQDENSFFRKNLPAAFVFMRMGVAKEPDDNEKTGDIRTG
jgi:hypothetical protein